ncbi:DJ-1/PfpI family protein [Arthrobacter rhizosphaerae]|uniref:DJ-1/PfpI family protein n=1 Tax=Arthrobacter rhizosphaerae TaxID=2855490 RepID=UPI001FF30257|nr:DJ-1/PfpI family protein [Arthrobacter rhizosphaerae]
MPKDEPLRIVIPLFPNVTQLDLTGPAQVFANYPNTEVHLVWHTLEPVETDCGWSIVPTTTFETCPPADVLFVPGGQGAFELHDDPVAIEFLRRNADGARWVTSVCTGSFALAAAGLLTGYRATSHWASLSMLSMFGATPVRERVVIDRNRITGAGITSGIEFAFVLAAQLFGDERAKIIQLFLEYDPQPGFDGGNPWTADPELISKLTAEVQGRRLPLVQQAVDRMNPVGLEDPAPTRV